LTETDKRAVKDRRKQPTPAWSLYTFLGRREWFRRKSDQEKAGYVDRYSKQVFFMLILILGLNIIDSLLTMMILDIGGKEFNPLVSSVMDLHGDKFWIWKFGMVSASLVLLCLHRGFKFFRGIIIAISSIYLVIVLYQVYLISHLITPAR
jgi:hypothetical protein